MDGLHNIGELVSFEGKQKMNMWNSDECDNIRLSFLLLLTSPPLFKEMYTSKVAKNYKIYIFACQRGGGSVLTDCYENQ